MQVQIWNHIRNWAENEARWKLVVYLFIIFVFPVFVLLGCLILPVTLRSKKKLTEVVNGMFWLPGFCVCEKCFRRALNNQCGRIWLRLYLPFHILTLYLLFWPVHILLTWYICLRGLTSS